MHHRSTAAVILALYGIIAVCLLWAVPDLIARIASALPFLPLIW